MGLIRALIDLYIMLLIVDVILSYLPQYRHTVWASNIRKLSNYTCGPVRSLINRNFPNEIPFDISPMVVIILLKILVALF